MVFVSKVKRKQILLIDCLMFKLILSGIIWSDHNTERQLILVDEPKHVLSLIENEQTN